MDFTPQISTEKDKGLSFSIFQNKLELHSPKAEKIGAYTHISEAAIPILK